MIAIINYGMGNLHSVQKAFAAVGADARVTSDKNVILQADKIVLPGVGAFGDCIKNLSAYNFIDVIEKVIASGRGLLGICLGLQILFAESEESPGVKGLNIFQGKVKKLSDAGVKVPHIGWNNITVYSQSPLFKSIENNSFVYFVHSFHAVPSDHNIVTAITEYGGQVTAAIGKENVHAVQFHPEKSGQIGLTILRNFKEMKV